MEMLILNWFHLSGRPDPGVCPPQGDLSSVGHAVKGDGFICCQRKYLRFFTDKVSSDFFASLRKVVSNIWSDGNEWQQTSWQWTMLSFVSLRNTVDVGEDTWEIQLEMFEKYTTICWDGNEWKQMIWQWLVPLSLITATWLVKNCSLNLSLDNVWPCWRFCKYDIVFCILIQ